MSFGITDPITGELAENKANRGGDNLTNPATWRTALDVPAVADGYTKAESNTRLNALAPRQAIQLPAGINATGVSGLNFGTGDFSIALPSFRLADYTISDTDSANIILSTHNTGNNRVRVGLRATGGVWRITFTDGSAADTTYDITPTVALVDNTMYSIALVFNRAGTAILYVNGVANGSVSIAAVSAIDIGSGNTNGYRLNGGTASVMMLAAAIAYNFSLPATTTSGVVGVAERYADGVWVRPSERQATFGVITGTPSATGGAAIASATTDGGDVTFTTGTFGFINLRVAPANILAARGLYRVKFTIAVTGGTLAASLLYNNTTVMGNLVEGNNEFLGEHDGTAQIYIRHLTSATSVTYTITNLEVYRYATTLDLQPQGIGRTIIDRSANRNHATVSGTTLPTYLQPTDGGKIVTRTSQTPNQQLLALAAFDAANRYRILSWTVTAVTGTPTISLGNASAGAQYVSGLTLATGVPTAITLLTSIAATANLWCASNSTDVIIHTITYERISD